MTERDESASLSPSHKCVFVYSTVAFGRQTQRDRGRQEEVPTSFDAPFLISTKDDTLGASFSHVTCMDGTDDDAHVFS